jgi:hypothetical protein
MSKLELTTEQRTVLLQKSRTQTRRDQKQYLQGLGGDGSARELDSALSRARHDESALLEAERREHQWLEDHSIDASTISQSVSQAVNFFLHSLIAGEFGPDDSCYARSDAFLKHAYVVARSTEIFIERLLTDRDGTVINHDEAEQHAVDYLRDHIA